MPKNESIKKCEYLFLKAKVKRGGDKTRQFMLHKQVQGKVKELFTELKGRKGK